MCLGVSTSHSLLVARSSLNVDPFGGLPPDFGLVDATVTRANLPAAEAEVEIGKVYQSSLVR